MEQPPVTRVSFVPARVNVRLCPHSRAPGSISRFAAVKRLPVVRILSTVSLLTRPGYSQCRPSGYLFSNRQFSCDSMTSGSVASTNGSTTSTNGSGDSTLSNHGPADGEESETTASGSTGSTPPASSPVSAAASSSSIPAAVPENKVVKPVSVANKQAAHVQELKGSQPVVYQQGGTQQTGTQAGNDTDPAAVSSAAAAISSTPVSSGASDSSGASASGDSINKGACTPFTGSKTGYAHTTYYYDGTVGACGCGTGGSMFPWSASPGGTNVYTAAGSQQLYGDGDMCGGGCGKCFQLTNTGFEAGDELGSCVGAGETMIVMMTNRCPQQGNEQWCSSPDTYGFDGHFDIMSKDRPEGWDNAVVKYEAITCPGDLSSEYQQCSCAGKSRMMRSLMEEMGAVGWSKA